ncbi:class I SAM-dependent methyltransferase [Sphingomonas japonica]|uniref:SAM-dependent methyltransferase n=1 Tax=Sphingomonas japonica TaxID=511662 RepID=A0ABX0U017_9SPHN|nr:methyltransferase domain-containing protein [Sphingomonas japonica]NIJ23915.1 SAM-dependent methyltransferase [Sphingomonas japonica]
MLRLLLTALILAVPAHAQDDRDAPYVPTPPSTVEAMLDIAGVQPGERWLDLGSGDGRIAIAAARRGARATGIERNPALVTRARYKAREAGVEARTRFRGEDLFTANVRDADIVSLYLLPEMNLKLRPRLLAEMQPGARIVSHAFDMGDWRPDRFERDDERRIYLWIVPAVVGGEWRATLPGGEERPLVLTQRYQQVSGTLGGAALSDVTLRGAKLTFVANGTRYVGTVDYGAIEGETGWRAIR